MTDNRPFVPTCGVCGEQNDTRGPLLLHGIKIHGKNLIDARDNIKFLHDMRPNVDTKPAFSDEWSAT
jgi:hypothetical protein